ncbi:MAG: 30S ribosomal protein S16 [Candidatus Omnitrophica bacterium]|jgi:small subunit ribosomal protein S16|nr:30S ribosomal protein S16 [Candidatus Omnitrophota bacterium]MDD4012987.1 30S ribosomal protein S16 [Candidatus Omnitrophota bacterium]
MAVVLRMKMFGTKKKPSYRIVAMTKTVRRDGKPLEELGYYQPKSKSADNAKLNMPRVEYWLKNGALPSPTVKSLIKRLTV